jgi:hypothetical protein
MRPGRRDRRSPGIETGIERGRRRLPIVTLAGITAVAILAAACVSGTATSTPGSQATPSPTAESSGGAKPTFWPTTTIDGTIALGAANDSLTKMAKDVTTAVDAQDPQKILIVMSDGLTFMTSLQADIGYLQAYPETKDVGDQLAAAYGQMIKGAQEIVDALKAGNGEGVQSGFSDFFAGSAGYAAVAPALGDLVSQAILMKRGFNQ